MNSEFSKENMLFTAPPVLMDDPGMRPIMELIADMMVRITSNTRLPIIYARINELPEDLLDILAQDFKVDWYDYDADLETKRNLIRDCFYVHRHLGTRSALQRAVADVYGEGIIEEWFEYEDGPGQPYHFRVHTSNTTVLLANRARFLRLVNIVKNVRSMLDNVTYDGEGSITIAAGAAVCCVEAQSMAVARRRTEVEYVE